MNILPQLEGKSVYAVRAIGDGALLGTSKVFISIISVMVILFNYFLN